MLGKSVNFKKLDGKGLKIGIVTARWNSEMTYSIRDASTKAIIESGVEESDIVQMSVPGTYEVVMGAKSLIEKEKVDAVICIGVLIKGSTMHFEYISEAVTEGIMSLSLSSGVPVVYGVLNCLTEDQALKRSTGEHNHGYDWGRTAVEMALKCGQK